MPHPSASPVSRMLTFGANQMNSASSPFDFAFEPVQGSVPPYLQLLNLADDAGQHIATIQQLALEPTSRIHIVAMLREVNWRPHLVAIVAATQVDGLEAEMWSAIDRASWVTPQIAAILSLVDKTFSQEADRRLKNGCLAQFREHAEPINPAQMVFFPKMDASLRGLRGLEGSQDRDHGDRIAVGWRTRFVDLASTSRK